MSNDQIREVVQKAIWPNAWPVGKEVAAQQADAAISAYEQALEDENKVVVDKPLIPLATEIGANRALSRPETDWDRGYDAAMQWCYELVKQRTDRMGLPIEVTE
jgi:hypothetical protein